MRYWAVRPPISIKMRPLTILSVLIIPGVSNAVEGSSRVLQEVSKQMFNLPVLL